MAKPGQLTAIVAAEIHEMNKAALSFGTYSKKYCKKNKKIHVAVQDSLHTPTVRMDKTAKRCTCGGWTFTTIWAGAKVACRHCGKQYFKSEFDRLHSKELKSFEVEDRRIFAMLLDGGDLREDKERDVLILKDANGIPEGELPLEFAKHLEHVFCDARIIKSVRSDEIKSHAVSLHVAPAGAL